MDAWLPQEVIRRKRDGLTLSTSDIQRFVAGITAKTLSEGQIAAFAMAVYMKGMTLDERIAFTTAVRDSGQVLAWPRDLVPGPVVDKHSTGGVGDFISLPLAPLLAATGCFVPMISGRGLGHTGGTLDKLESIPGYVATPEPDTFRRVTADVGCCIIGQTADLAPADKTLYGIRDVTATVESVDLITASILGKKLAAGLDVLVMDVKTGSGAFMAKVEQAEELAASIVAVANGAGTRTRALITDMEAPLARSAGNAVEVEEAVALLKGEVRSERLWEITLALAEETLVEARLAETRAQAREKLLAAWEGGEAAKRFGRMVEALGGPADFMDDPAKYLPKAPVVVQVFADQDGVVEDVDTRSVGLAVVALGGGRRRPQDDVDPAVGFTKLAFPGEQVGTESKPIGVVHAQSEQQAKDAATALKAAYRIGAKAKAEREVVLMRL
ncbi:thymidine phosphorylase [Diplodia corticola]|uniref:Thymidine phosphorylase n=1 Tax=Diplodia corticola TaxID=236234 RepID=A0A1J9RSQ1_9PEZI|nr:thymidine phosphorylase [Diplodia corticola]OJD30573.1 thymidine phosphorylase [Diplodia corticola]